MTEEDLIEMGFETRIIPPEEAGDLKGYYYYFWEPNDSSYFGLITCANDELKKGRWTVDIVNSDITLKKKEDVQDIIRIIKNNI